MTSTTEHKSQTSNALARRQEQQQERQKTLAKKIEQMKPEIARAIPRHLNPDRMARIATTVMRRTPKLAECTPESFLGALMTSAQLGLEPGPLGHAYYVPYKQHKRACTSKFNCDCPSEVTFITGYKGLVELARRSGQVSTVYARVVREGDHFDYEFGLNPRLEHKPADDIEKPLTHVYAVIVYKDGGKDFDVMTLAEVERIRTRSRAAKDGPWVTDYPEMAKKTVLRRLCKTAPMSVEYQQAMSNDEQTRTSVAAEDIDLSVPIDDPEAIDGEVVDEPADGDWPAATEPGSGGAQ